MSSLAEIAFDMQQQANRNAVSYRELARGLSLQLRHCGGARTLYLSRPVVKPSEEEVAICRRLFSVPADASRADGHNSVELRWTL